LATILGIAAVLIFSAVLAQSARIAGIASTKPAPLATAYTPFASGYPAPIVTGAYPTDYPPVKLTLEYQIEQTRNAALAGTLPPTNAKGAPPTLVSTEPPWPTGIIEDGESPFSASFVFKNRWQQVVGGQRIIVFAGSKKSDPSQGVVVVWEISTDQVNSVNNVYPTSIRDGALRIVAATGLRLTLAGAGGRPFYFDAPSRQFVQSLTAPPPPTVTRLPSSVSSPLPTAYP
jgi:hypothetical protein